MKLIDWHADTITTLYDEIRRYHADQEKNPDAAMVCPSLAHNNLRVDLDKLVAADSLAQFFVLWLNLRSCEKYQVRPWDHFVTLYNFLHEQIAAANNQIELVHNLPELKSAMLHDKLAGFISVEEGAFISSLFELEAAYNMGVRYITLVWNYETHIGVPSCIDQTRGLKPFGREMVEYMQLLNMLVDVSHLSDQGVRDVLAIAKSPIIASHSDARALCEHTRNLPDELLQAIANNGGIIGIGCVPNFLDSQYKTIKIDTMIRHIQHVYNVAGIDAIAIGNDFDGYTCYTPQDDEIKTIADVPKLAVELGKAGFTHEQIEKIFYKNSLRVLSVL